MGSKHQKYDYIYPLNYGYIPGTQAADGEEIDAYVLGIFTPITHFVGVVKAIIHRINDNEDKLVVMEDDKNYSDDAILALTEF